MTNPPDRELAVFSAARQLPSRERAAYLDEACAGDAALRQRIEELLQAGEAAGDFLKQPASLGPGGTVQIPVTPAEKPGDQIGHYKLLQQIGEGGCGVVYMAEQEQPVRRRVALKVIKLGMDTKNVIARFEAERQALALMDHPNIAKVLDAGATNTGRPYFVMELVRGIKITDYCDENNLSTKERLDLFIKVCQAIQHAHQKGLIHRDIKPSNILVTMSDGLPLPKVIDFGIAKATHGKLTDQTLFTAFEQFIGTPAYMSPEQAEMSAQDIDTRSDIYSLGVLLYELLTGQTPFNAEKLLRAGLDEIRRTIREEEPARPSTRLSTMLAGELTTAARHRQTEPPKLIHLVRGDLDWIVMKALEKNRARRYETANGFAADLQRHLNNEPVVACPPSNVYKFQKLVRRNKFLFASVAAVLAALMIGLGVSSYLYLQEKQARRLAAEAQRKAQSEAELSSQVAKFLMDMLGGASPSVSQGKDTTLLMELLERSLHSVGTELTNQPIVVAEVQNTIAEALMNLGENRRAETVLRDTLALEKRELGEENIYVVHTLLYLSLVEKPDEAKLLLYEAIRICKKLGNAENWLWQCQSNLANLLVGQGELAASEAMYRQGLELANRIFAKDDVRIVYAMNALAHVLQKQQKLEEAKTLYRKALERERKKPAEKNLASADALLNIASIAETQGRLDEAEKMFRESSEVRSKLLGNQDIGTINAFSSLERILLRENKTAEARKIMDEVISPALERNPKNLVLLNLRGDFLARQGLWKSALPDTLTAFRLNPVATFLSYGTLLAATGDWEGYRRHCDDCLDKYGDTKDPTRAHWLVRTCMLAPIDDPHREVLNKLADLQLSGGKSSAYYADDENCKGTLEYYAGHFENARNWISNSIVDRVGTNEDDFMAQMGNWSLLAMCHTRLKEDSQARAALATADGLAAKMPKLEDGNIGVFWRYWVLNMRSYNAAKVLIDGGRGTNTISR